MIEHIQEILMTLAESLLKCQSIQALLLLHFFAAIGLPGLSGFISETFVFLGAFSNDVIRVITIVSTLGILLGAGYMLWTMQRVYLGTLKEKWMQLKDLDGREYAMFIPLTLIIIFLGVYPSAMLDIMNASVNSMVKFMQDSQVFFSSINRVMQ